MLSHKIFRKGAFYKKCCLTKVAQWHIISNMNNTVYEYSPEKNQQLIKERRISFEEIIAAIDNGGLLDIIEHINKSKYSNQKMYVVWAKDYVYLVPFVKKDEETVFLKTIFPSRKAKKNYTRMAK